MATKKTRLIAFGCSSTYGQGLPDCPTGKEPPSSLVWPSLVAKQLNRELVNTSICGAPNKKILHQILEFPFQKNDIAITLWSLHHRGYLFEEYKKHVPVLVQNKEYELFYKIHSEYDLLVDTTFFMHHASAYLKTKGIINFNFFFDHVFNWHLRNQENVVDVDAHYAAWKELKVDDSPDGIHVGVNSQKNLAQFILDRIQPIV